METLIIDSDILIDFLRGINVNDIDKLKTKYELATTDVNVFELYNGAYSSKNSGKNLRIVKGLLNSLKILSTSESAMKMAAKLINNKKKKVRIIDLRDLFIASICLINSSKLFTGNKKHFKNISGLKLI